MLIQGIESDTRIRVRCDIHNQKYICQKHVHHFAELVLILDGKLTVTVNEKSETATKNQFIFLFPFQKHEYTSDDVSNFIICTFPISLLPDFAMKTSDKIGNKTVFDASDLAVSLFKQKIIEEENISPYGIYSCLYTMLDDFNRQIELIKSDTDATAVDKLVYYVNENYKNPLPLSAVARAIGYSPNYLSHCIFRALGMNYRAFLGSARAEQAKILLKKTELSILNIAFECGYPNVRSFQRHFKSLVGLSPAEYRKQRSTYYSNTVNSVDKSPRRICKDILM